MFSDSNLSWFSLILKHLKPHISKWWLVSQEINHPAWNGWCPNACLWLVSIIRYQGSPSPDLGAVLIKRDCLVFPLTFVRCLKLLWQYLSLSFPGTFCVLLLYNYASCLSQRLLTLRSLSYLLPSLQLPKSYTHFSRLNETWSSGRPIISGLSEEDGEFFFFLLRVCNDQWVDSAWALNTL